MYRPAARTILRSGVRPNTFAPARSIGGRRFISTEPAHLKSRSWKSSALRWGIAAAGIYYYNTSPVFAEQPQHNLLNPNVDAIDTEGEHPTLDALTASSRQKSQKDASVLQSTIESASASNAPSNSPANAVIDVPADASPVELEEEAEGEGAFNPVTGEINWDCPCLGGMAHGPCGPQFREAFSCFVYSTEEPKGMECIDKFQNMQNCFREHPDVYKGEIEDDEELDGELAEERENLKQEIAQRKADNEAKIQEKQKSSEDSASTPKKKKSPKKAVPKSEAQGATPGSSEPHSGMSDDHESINEGQKSSLIRSTVTPGIESESTTEGDALLPKAAHDARGGTGLATDK